MNKVKQFELMQNSFIVGIDEYKKSGCKDMNTYELGRLGAYYKTLLDMYDNTNFLVDFMVEDIKNNTWEEYYRRYCHILHQYTIIEYALVKSFGKSS